jgi:hypothetical protein
MVMMITVGIGAVAKRGSADRTSPHVEHRALLTAAPKFFCASHCISGESTGIYSLNSKHESVRCSGCIRRGNEAIQSFLVLGFLMGFHEGGGQPLATFQVLAQTP